MTTTNKFCPFLPPAQKVNPLSQQPALMFMACQLANCALYDEASQACGLKNKVNIDMGKKEIHIGKEK